MTHRRRLGWRLSAGIRTRAFGAATTQTDPLPLSPFLLRLSLVRTSGTSGKNNSIYAVRSNGAACPRNNTVLKYPPKSPNPSMLRLQSCFLKLNKSSALLPSTNPHKLMKGFGRSVQLYIRRLAVGQSPKVASGVPVDI